MRILGDRLLLSPLPDKEKSDGGIILPNGESWDRRMYWRVEQVGGKMKHPEIQPGVIVVTPLNFTHTHLEDGTDRRIVGCDQIEAVFVDELPAVPDI